MAKLLSLEVLKSSLAQCDTDAAAEMLNSAAEMATAILSGYLRTPFDRLNYVDHFDFNDRNNMDAERVPLYVKPKAGFIEPASPVPVIDVAADFATLTSNPTAIAATDYLLDASKGVIKIMILTEGLADLFSTRITTKSMCRVTYTAGFSDKADDVGRVYIGVPQWLQEAARLMTIYLYDQLIVAKGSDQQVQPLTSVPQSVQMMLDGHVRVHQTAVTPL